MCVASWLSVTMTSCNYNKKILFGINAGRLVQSAFCCLLAFITLLATHSPQGVCLCTTTNRVPFMTCDPYACCRGTQGWTAPELYSQNLHPSANGRTNVTATADMYAAGWVFFEVLCGLSPLLFLESSTDDEFAASELTHTVSAHCLCDRLPNDRPYLLRGEMHCQDDCNMHTRFYENFVTYDVQSCSPQLQHCLSCCLVCCNDSRRRFDHPCFLLKNPQHSLIC